MHTVILESTDEGEIPVDVYQKLAENRVLFIHEFISDKVACDIIASMFALDLEDHTEPIQLFINSPGGDIRCVFMVYDVLKTLKSPIHVICIGGCMDSTSLLLAAGKKGARFATQNAIIGINQLYVEHSNYGTLTDAKQSLELSKLDNSRMLTAYSKCTGKSVKDLEAALTQRLFLSPQEALKFGLIDKVIKLNNAESKNTKSKDKKPETKQKSVKTTKTEAKKTTKKVVKKPVNKKTSGKKS